MSTLSILESSDVKTHVSLSVPCIAGGLAGAACFAVILRAVLKREAPVAAAPRIALKTDYDVGSTTNGHLASLSQSKEYQDWMQGKMDTVTEQIEHLRGFLRSLYLTVGCIYIAALAFGWYSIPQLPHVYYVNDAILACFVVTIASFFLPGLGFKISAFLGLSGSISMLAIAAIHQISHPGTLVVTAFSFVGPLVDVIDSKYNGPREDQLKLLQNPHYERKTSIFSW
ncbi:hypothetical protein DIPPA_06652 [Diplonema papillatum]|nr:hypothetical protein DIPPA_06652 [Diplonema papillatum]